MSRVTLIDAHRTVRQLQSFGVPNPYRMLAPLHYAEALVDEMRDLGIDMHDPQIGSMVELEFRDGLQLVIEVAESVRGQ